MKLYKPAASQAVAEAENPARLDLVIPFTTPALTAAALRAAQCLSSGLHADIRLLRVQVVPYPLELARPPVPVAFLEQQLDRLCRGAGPAVQCDIRSARDFVPALRAALTAHSVVILATPKRLWRTRTERLGRGLRKAGYTVLMIAAQGSLAQKENYA